jgi:hypothetical protein
VSEPRRGRRAIGGRRPLLDGDLAGGPGRPDAEGAGPECDHGGCPGRDPHRRVQPIAVGGTGDLEAVVGVAPDPHRIRRERGVQADGELRGDPEPVARVREEDHRGSPALRLEPCRHRAPDLGRGRDAGRAEQHEPRSAVPRQGKERFALLSGADRQHARGTGPRQLDRFSERLERRLAGGRLRDDPHRGQTLTS